MKESNCIIIHGASFYDREKIKQGKPPQNKRNWIPWIKEQLEKRGIKTFTPLMPKNWNPKYEEWKKEFERLYIDEESILIGHSAGGTFLVRWLEETKQKIKKLILVSPGKLTPYEFMEDLYNFEINPLIKNNVQDIIIITADDDYLIKDAEDYSKKLEVKLTNLGEGYGHFVEEDMGTEKFPELLQEILNDK